MADRVPLNLKVPAKSPKERRAFRTRIREARIELDAVCADLKRQAVEPSVVTRESLKALPGPKLLHIAVPDSDDWTTFCAKLLQVGEVQWMLQGDREARFNDNDPSVPRFKTKTWAAFRKALLQVGKQYWGPRGKAGRPDMFGRCWRAFWKECKTPNVKFRESDRLPLINGHPITQGKVERMIRKGDPGIPSPLSDEVCRKYGRVLYLTMNMRHQPLSPSDDAFLEKYLLPWFKKNPDLFK